MVSLVTASESRRHELYNGLALVIGPELTETLMSFLPPVPFIDLATKDDIAGLGTELRTEMTELRTEMTGFKAEVRSELRDLGKRIDRIYLTLLAGFVSITVALVAGIIL